MKTCTLTTLKAIALAWLVALSSAGSAAATTRHYKLTFHALSGDFAGQSYSGSFDVDESGVTGVGTEILPITTVDNLEVTMFGTKRGPFQNGAQPVYVDGKLMKIIAGFGVPSATEGNKVRSIGINNGFTDAQVPVSLRAGRWWGYLDTANFIDGFGDYDLELQPMIAKSYTITFRATSGTFTGQSYQGSFDVDTSSVTGVGTETLPITTVDNLEVTMFGTKRGPFANAAQPVFVDGKLVRIIGGFGVPSATEGNKIRSIGINNGFNLSQVPINLRAGAWWGYLNPATFIDGFGPYEITPKPVLRHYRVTFHATSGKFAGQDYPGSFDVDVSGLKGIGTETLPFQAVNNLKVNMFGSDMGPFANGAQTVFVDGRLVKIIGGFGVRSATEGNKIRSIGINNGFTDAQVPSNLRAGRWWGYLNTSSTIDGFGPYDLEEVMDLRIFTAVELEFGTRIGRTYQIQSLIDLGAQAGDQWTNVGTPVTGIGAPMTKLISIRGTSHKNFRVEESNP